jgi:hypothetical protein
MAAPGHGVTIPPTYSYGTVSLRSATEAPVSGPPDLAGASFIWAFSCENAPLLFAYVAQLFRSVRISLFSGIERERSPMTLEEEYLFKAAQLSALAEDEANPSLRLGFKQLAEHCLRQAVQLDKTTKLASGVMS